MTVAASAMPETPHHPLQRARVGLHHALYVTGWPVRLAVSVGMAAFLGVMATISFPLPWTPVPFSMTPFALLVVGAYQRPLWAGLSVVMYLVAGAAGAPIYAEGASGWQHLVGSTAVTSGYLFGYVLVAVFVAWYMQERRALLPTRWAAVIGAFLLVTVVAGIIAIIRFTGSGTGFDAYGDSYEGWAFDTSLLWVFAFLTVAAAAVTAWSILRARGQGREALNLYLAFIAATGLLHVCGVIGLVVVAGMAPVTAIIVGSVAFLPFDIVKAGLGVALTLPFVPTAQGPAGAAPARWAAEGPHA